MNQARKNTYIWDQCFYGTAINSNQREWALSQTKKWYLYNVVTLQREEAHLSQRERERERFDDLGLSLFFKFQTFCLSLSACGQLSLLSSWKREGLYWFKSIERGFVSGGPSWLFNKWEIWILFEPLQLSPPRTFHSKKLGTCQFYCFLNLLKICRVRSFSFVDWNPHGRPAWPEWSCMCGLRWLGHHKTHRDLLSLYLIN